MKVPHGLKKTSSMLSKRVTQANVVSYTNEILFAKFHTSIL